MPGDRASKLWGEGLNADTPGGALKVGLCRHHCGSCSGGLHPDSLPLPPGETQVAGGTTGARKYKKKNPRHGAGAKEALKSECGRWEREERQEREVG